jgi:membrane-bound lytic murein transglycosylase D
MKSKILIHRIILVSLTMISGYDNSINISDISHSSDKKDFTENYYYDSIPRYPDMFYEYRIAELNKLTPIELDYNETVKKFIENYSVNRRDEFARIIGLAELYFPIFDNMLDKYDLPLELKYLTIVESSLNINAKSKSGAVGLWQFLLNTCKLFDLEVNSYIDERRDPYKSTDAACRYLKYLYNTYNDWQLVLSSYNSGPGDIRKAIERSNGKTGYWEIRPYLSGQAQDYVPAFIASLYLMNHYKEHNIEPVVSEFNFNNIDTLWINYPVSFNQISDITGVTADELRFLNPVYRRDFIPDLNKPALLILPKEKVDVYLKNESRILGDADDIDDYNSLVSNAGSTENKIKIIHVVRKGEFFHKIALKYNCTLENIKAWNNITDNFLYPGQELIIWIDSDFSDNDNQQLR